MNTNNIRFVCYIFKFYMHVYMVDLTVNSSPRFFNAFDDIVFNRWHIAVEIYEIDY